MTEPEFGARLKQLRQNKHMTQQELADQLGVSNKSVSRWESGGYPDIAILPSLAKVLDVTTDELLGCQPPLRAFGRSDWQNLMSYTFALGGGVVFYLLDLFMPSVICYLIYLAMMAYGIYLQRHYTYHSHWFYGANALMDFFVNLQLTAFVAGTQMLFSDFGTLVLYTKNTLTHNPADGWAYIGPYLLDMVHLVLPWLSLSLALTAVTQWGIFHTDGTQMQIRLSKSGFSLSKAIPVLSPAVLCGFFALFLVEDTKYALAYEGQDVLYLLLWLVMTILAAVWLLFRGHKWMLLPTGTMQLLCLSFPTWASRRVYSDISNRFMPYNPSLREGMYTIFRQFSPTLVLAATILTVLYLLCCTIKIELSPK